jgi:hypothetical protein
VIAWGRTGRSAHPFFRLLPDALVQAVPYRWDGSPADQVSEQMSNGGR